MEQEGDILVYSSYEKTITRGLAELLPHLREKLTALSERYVDLYRLVVANYYHPDFHGSYSLKAVLPALVPDMTYGDLEVREGSAGVPVLRQDDPLRIRRKRSASS